jgi:hypothetical protein
MLSFGGDKSGRVLYCQLARTAGKEARLTSK